MLITVPELEFHCNILDTFANRQIENVKPSQVLECFGKFEKITLQGCKKDKVCRAICSIPSFTKSKSFTFYRAYM